MQPLSDPLSKREQEILKYLAEGLSNREIAGRLHLAYQTVKSYNSDIYSKLGVTNRDEAIVRATNLGLLAAPSDASQPLSKHNLPESVTEFVGRKKEINELSQLIDSKRLITILAPGGMGKTRLSMEIARTKIANYRDGVYFIPLAPLSSPDDIVTTIAENIGFVFHGENPPAQQLVNYLKNRQMLFVLDNFEHLLGGAGLASEIIKLASDIRIIVTSRERLNLYGENVYNLHGLNFPLWETPEDASEYDAVKLLMQSARRVRSDFELRPDDLDFLARICRLTAGLPLGIELAAGWVDVLSLEQIAFELQQGIDILETDMRDIPERHRNLRATFERSWQRLTDEQQTIFAKLSVFRGGFTLESATAVTSTSIRHLHKLVQKALIHTESDIRYTIHELLRQFGEGKLVEIGERPDIQAKHAQFFMDFMAARMKDIKTGRQLEAVRLIEPDYNNIRMAWLYVVDQQRWEQLSPFLLSFRFYWDVNAMGQDAMALLEPVEKVLRTLPQTDVTKLALGRVLGWFGWALLEVGFFERSEAICEEAIDILQQYDSPDDLLGTYQHLMYPKTFLRQMDIALKVAQAGLALARSAEDPYWEAVMLHWLCQSQFITGDFKSAIRVGMQAVALCEDLGLDFDLAEAEMRLGDAYMLHHQYEEATYWLEKSLETFYIFDKAALIGSNHNDLGWIAYKQQKYSIALQQFGRAIQVCQDAGYTWIHVGPLVSIAEVYAALDVDEKAARILAATLAKLQPINLSIEQAPALRKILEERMAPEQFAESWSQGEATDLNTLIIELLAELPEG